MLHQIPEFKDQIKAICNSLERIVIEKNLSYGNSVVTTAEMMKWLFPNGIPVEQFKNALMIVRVLDKLMRIATDKDAFGESPWKDISGYAILAQVDESINLL